MQILVNQYIDKNKWQSFISDNSFTTPFQTPEFFNFFNSVSGLSAWAFAVEDADELKALCVITYQREKGIKGYFSRRAIIYGGPIVSANENSVTALTFLLKAIKHQLKHKVIYVENRNFNDYFNFKKSFKTEAWSYQPYFDIKISLQGKSIDTVLGALKYNRRREIIMSLKEGAVYKVAENTEEVKALYHILENLYKKRVKLPLPSLDFFDKLFKSDVGKVFIVLHQNLVIGGSFCFYYPQNSIYTMYYCGLRDYHPKIFPSHLAIIAAIDFGLKNDLKTVDLMGAGKPGKEYGVRKYKSEFGGEQVEYGRYVRKFNPFLYNIGKMGLSIIRKIKK